MGALLNVVAGEVRGTALGFVYVGHGRSIDVTCLLIVCSGMKKSRSSRSLSKVEVSMYDI